MSSINVLHQAAINRDVATIQRILEEEGIWKPTDDDGETVLHLVFKCKYRIALRQESIVQTLECLLNEGLSINLKNAAGRTILFLAIDSRLHHVTDFLVQHGANVNVRDQNGNSIIHLLIEEQSKNYCNRGPTFQEFLEQDHINTLTWLLSIGVNVHLRNNEGMTAIKLAIQQNMKHILPTLIKHDVNYVVENGSTILESLFKTRASINTKYDVEIVECLLAFVDHLDIKGNTLVHKFLKSYDPNPEIIRRMLQHYKNVNAQDQNGNTVLHHVIKNSLNYLGQHKEHSIDFVRTLLSKNANVHLKNQSGNTAVCYAMRVKHIEVLKALLEYGADASPSANTGALFLHDICDVPSIEDKMWAPMVDTLVQAGWNVNAVRPADHFTPLMEACRSRCPRIVQKLIENGANVNYVKKRNGMRPIHVAMISCTYRDANTAAFFEMLARAGAKVNVKNKRGQTALHLVPICGYPTMKKLLQLGANVDARDKTGRLPLHEAVKNKDTGAIRALLQFGAEVNDVDLLRELKRMLMIEPGDDEIQILTGPDFNVVTEEMKATVDCLTKHWLRLKAADLPVVDGYEDFAKNNSLQEFYLDCLKEVEIMKTHHVSDRITLHNLLQMNVNLKYNFIVKRLKRLVASQLFIDKYPKYSIVIKAHYRKALARSPLIEPARRAWDYLTGIRLPDCVEQILTYLGNEDLRVMAEEEEKINIFKRPTQLMLGKPTKRKLSKSDFAV